jgi:acetyl esterase/lipase|tara:strand:- start:384 stop:686 length:303 start_codon:yes stop_codon:yes gene_type:complete
MKNYTGSVFALLVALVLGGLAELGAAVKVLSYKTEKDLPYRTVKEGEADGYVKNRCRLDLYYPSDKKGFATIVWFHGGGLRKGNKTVPNQLKKQGLAVWW